jgi:hypothetical protein
VKRDHIALSDIEVRDSVSGGGTRAAVRALEMDEGVSSRAADEDVLLRRSCTIEGRCATSRFIG